MLVLYYVRHCCLISFIEWPSMVRSEWKFHFIAHLCFGSFAHYQSHMGIPEDQPCQTFHHLYQYGSGLPAKLFPHREVSISSVQDTFQVGMTNEVHTKEIVCFTLHQLAAESSAVAQNTSGCAMLVGCLKRIRTLSTQVVHVVIQQPVRSPLSG